MKRIILITFFAVLCVWSGHAQLIKPAARSSSIVTIDGQGYYVHTVGKGETIYSLSRLYGVAENDILTNNPQLIDGLKADQVIKIPVVMERPIKPRKMARMYDEHMVNQGETAYAISRRYGITVSTLMEDNPGLDPTVLSPGQRLNIRKKSVGEATTQEIERDWSAYTEAASSVSDDYIYHLVAQGETVFSLSRQYGVTQHELMKSNDLSEGLKAGQMIRVPDRQKLAAAGKLPAEERPETDGGDLTEEGRRALQAKTYGRGSALRVAILLPMRGEGKMNPNFLDFYQGALLALEDLKARGVSVNLDLYNTDRSEYEIERIVAADEFRETDLIIGPVYEEGLKPVLDFASRRRIPVVSPLGGVKMTENPLLYQMHPDAAYKCAKLQSLLGADRNVVVISAGRNDAEFEREIAPLLPSGHRTIQYAGRTMPVTAFENAILPDAENVFVVLAENEYTVDEILARISSVQNNLVARSIRNAQISVIGTSRWGRFAQADKNLFFKLGVHFVTVYHADRSDPAVSLFDRRYVAHFGTLPNPYAPYAYRGYDAVKLFAGTAGEGTNRFEESINADRIPLLQTSYHFRQAQPGMTRVNDQWMLVHYRPDYTIEVR